MYMLVSFSLRCRFIFGQDPWPLKTLKLQKMCELHCPEHTAWCSEISSRTSMWMHVLGASSDVREPISLHQAVVLGTYMPCHVLDGFKSICTTKFPLALVGEQPGGQNKSWLPSPCGRHWLQTWKCDHQMVLLVVFAFHHRIDRLPCGFWRQTLSIAQDAKVVLYADWDSEISALAWPDPWSWSVVSDA